MITVTVFSMITRYTVNMFYTTSLYTQDPTIIFDAVILVFILHMLTCVHQLVKVVPFTCAHGCIRALPGPYLTTA